jgi:hypothetical protein
MVRILEVKELETKKKQLVTRSEIHRQTLALEATNIKLALALVRKRMRVAKTLYRLFGWAMPIGGLVFGQKQKEKKIGFLARLLSGFNLARRIKSLISSFRTGQEEEEEAHDSTRI